MLEKHESLRDTRCIDAVCDRFEEAWLSGERPSLESLLPAVPEHCRGRLFQELLGVEIKLRRRAGESPTPDEYRRKYPEFSDHIASGLTHSHSRSLPNLPHLPIQLSLSPLPWAKRLNAHPEVPR